MLQLCLLWPLLGRSELHSRLLLSALLLMAWVLVFSGSRYSPRRWWLCWFGSLLQDCARFCKTYLRCATRTERAIASSYNLQSYYCIRSQYDCKLLSLTTLKNYVSSVDRGHSPASSGSHLMGRSQDAVDCIWGSLVVTSSAQEASSPRGKRTMMEGSLGEFNRYTKPDFHKTVPRYRHRTRKIPVLFRT